MVQKLPFLSRIAFICNLVFVLCLLLQWKYIYLNQALTSTLIITGLFLAPFVFNPVCNLCYLLLLIRKKPLPLLVPKWLAWSNFIFLLVQILFALFFLYDPFHS